MKKSDLAPDNFPELKWESGKYAVPLSQLCNYATSQASNAINWYYKSRRGRRYFCRLCRLVAILLTAFAGILPLINEIVLAGKAPSVQITQVPNAPQAEPGQAGGQTQPRFELLAKHTPRIHPLWSAVALAVAATLIMVDRFYGFTTGWVRYLLTAQQLTQALETFRLDVDRQKLTWTNLEPDQDQAKALVSTIQQFCSQTRRIISDETNRWATEFADVLKQIDEQMKTAAQANQKGAIMITITNGDQCATGWALTVDERSPELRSGKEASVEVLQGMHIVRVSGEIAGRPVRAEQPIRVGPGEIGKLSLVLT